MTEPDSLAVLRESLGINNYGHAAIELGVLAKSASVINRIDAVELVKDALPMFPLAPGHEAQLLSEAMRGFLPEPWASSLDPFLRQLESVSTVPSARVGSAMGLLVTGRLFGAGRGPKGTVLPLSVSHVRSSPAGHISGDTGSRIRQQALGAIHIAADAAMQLIVDHFNGAVVPAITNLVSYLRSWSAEAAVPPVVPDLDGESLGLAAGVATLSRLLNLHVPQQWAFSGALLRDGRVLAVEGIPGKLHSARERGMTHVVLPLANESTRLPAFRDEAGLQVAGTDNLTRVAEALWSPDSLRRALESLLHRCGAARAQRSPSQVAEDQRPRLLLSWAATNDPFGRNEDGPILACIRAEKVRAIVLFHDSNAQPRQDQVKAPNYGELTAEAAGLGRRRGDVVDAPLTSPTDYRAIWGTLLREEDRLTREFPPDKYQWVANVSSGTKAMHLAWFWWKHLRPGLGLRTVEVQETRYLKAGEPRVREVDLDTLR